LHARLIGVEYIISRAQFEALPEAEKKYWHSHVYEVKGGIIVMPRVPEAMERTEMEKLVNTYGKTWHFWQVDRGDPLPYGEPQLMCSLVGDRMVDASVLEMHCWVFIQTKFDNCANILKPLLPIR
jgi:hypothetical protein